MPIFETKIPDNVIVSQQLIVTMQLLEEAILSVELKYAYAMSIQLCDINIG